MTEQSSNRIKILVSTAFCGLMLFGCQNSSSQTGMYQQALESRQQITHSNAGEAVQLYERLYARNSGDIGITVKYAEALRKAGMPQQALTVLSPLAESQMKAKPAVLVEYAASNIAVGRFMHAQHALDKFYGLDKKNAADKDDLQPQALNLNGLVLSASGHHAEAEEKYREALASWLGNPSIVMNNLALSLAQQGKFDEALDFLEQAQRQSTPEQQGMHDQNLALVEKLQKKSAKKK
tara:strand:+ start:73 stop:783 length:711 start_codon:yes stop_codon:yes gene_type:complete